MNGVTKALLQIAGRGGLAGICQASHMEGPLLTRLQFAVPGDRRIALPEGASHDPDGVTTLLAKYEPNWVIDCRLSETDKS